MEESINDFQYSRENFYQFKNWLSLNLEAVTWQGRYEREFNNFWNLFFAEGQSLKQMNERFEFATLNSQIGPLVAWFLWLNKKFVCFTFIHKEINIISLSRDSGIGLPDLATILRDFFVDANPHLEEEIGDIFQISNYSHKNLNLNFKDVSHILPLSTLSPLENEDEIMTSMEITLYPEFIELVEKFQKSFSDDQFNLFKIKSKITIKGNARILRDVSLLIFFSFVIINAIKYTNKKWEQVLLEKISIYEPQLKWLNKQISFKRDIKNEKSELQISPEDLEKAETTETNEFDKITTEEEARYDPESEVSLTSWDSLPKDFATTDLEQSDYEELKKRGYRDSRYGNTKVYRVMMKSEDTLKSKNKLNNLLNKYGVTQVDHVIPGKSVPGGIYYNIYVPREFLKEFMVQAMELGDSVLYESRTRAGKNPPGKNKVFIWVKSI